MTDYSIPLNPGPPLAGKYRVDRVIGRGGMGVVVLAWHLQLHEWRAIKFLRHEPEDKPEHVVRFLREARAVVKIKSPHAVKVLDTGRLASGEPFMVMEYLEGEDLKFMLRRRGRLPVSEAVGYVLQLLEALDEAHRRGIIHRDLKPGNLFVTRGPAGEPFLKVLDFGISKLQAATDLTDTSDTVGTPHYMSPTHMLSSRNVDQRDDLWSVGVILYQLLVERLPFPGETLPEVCLRVAQDTPVRPSVLEPTIPPALDAVIMRCLEKKREQRYANATELSAALAPLSAYRPAQPSIPEGSLPAFASYPPPAHTSAAEGPLPYVPPPAAALQDTELDTGDTATLSMATPDAAVIQTGAHAIESKGRAPLALALLAAVVLAGTSVGLGVFFLSGRGTTGSAPSNAAATSAAAASASQPDAPRSVATAAMSHTAPASAAAQPAPAATVTASASSSNEPAASTSLQPPSPPVPKRPWPSSPSPPEPDEPEDPFAK